ncbi:MULTISPECIES: ABC transporter ATP-binding protein [unclassified Streptomyces]|uniref:ABC transporter ATP-binding protein n=1 Tax=unclassified Streptomyces TaxID=2593676 RepID=UPI0035E2E0A4
MNASPPSAPPPATLEVDDLTVLYGRSVRALDGVSLRVPSGAIVALLGANGAGKSTLLRAVSGTLPLHSGAVTHGSVVFGGTPLTGRQPADVVAAGVVQVPEGRRVFTALSVEENLRAGRLGLTGRHRAGAREAMEQVYSLFPVLAERRRQAAGLLSGGEQQMLALGRALMARPRLLLLDEPSLGLAPQMVEQIAGIIRRIHEQGVGVLLVEQNAALALRLADTAYVLEVGRVRLSGDADELSRSDGVRRLYLGERAEADDELEPEPVGAEPRTLSRWAG